MLALEQEKVKDSGAQWEPTFGRGWGAHLWAQGEGRDGRADVAVRRWSAETLRVLSYLF